MLASRELMAFVATTDGARAKAFYRDVLGLKLVSDESFALVFDANGTMLRISKLQQFEPQEFTVLGWKVPDIAAAVKELASKGVRFERYPGMNQDEHGVWQSPSGARVAWFKDPDRNTLSLTQF